MIYVYVYHCVSVHACVHMQGMSIIYERNMPRLMGEKYDVGGGRVVNEHWWNEGAYRKCEVTKSALNQ